nr:hypothetical protein [Candidatus Microthrix sp.]
MCTGHNGWVSGVAYSPDGTRIATAGHDGTARVFDAATGEELTVCTGHNGWVSGVAYSPDGTRIATAGHDGTAGSSTPPPARNSPCAPATTAR